MPKQLSLVIHALVFARYFENVSPSNSEDHL
jgi:hypothetical protein